MVKEKIELSDEVERFLDQKSPSTAATYRTSLRRFKRFYGKSIIDFIKVVKLENQEDQYGNVEDVTREQDSIVNQFIQWAKDDGASNNTIRLTLAALQNLFKFYKVSLTYSFVSVPKPIPVKENKKHSWSIADIKEFVEKAHNYRDKSIILIMFQAGQAVGEVCSIDYGDIREQLESGETPIMINMVREKNSNVYKTFIGADTINMLRKYLDTRGELKDSDPLFAKKGGKRMTVGAVQARLRELAEEVFEPKNGGMNPYRAHSFRAAFRSQLVSAKVDSDLIKFWMGDVLGPKAGAYLNMLDEDMRDIYISVEDRLSIYVTSEEQIWAGTTDRAEIRSEFSERVSGLETGMGSLVEMLKEREEEIQALKETIMNNAERMGNLEASIEYLVSRAGLEDEMDELTKQLKA